MKKNLIVFGMMVGVLLGSADVGATPAMPCQYQVRPGLTGRAQDFGRSIVGFITSIINLCGDGEAKAELIAKQEANNSSASGSSGSASSTDTSSGQLDLGTAGESEFSGSAFDYVNANILAKEGNVDYDSLKTALASANDEATVRTNIQTAVKKFFADPSQSDQNTSEYKAQVRQEREEYARKAANRHVTLAYKVKGYIQNDLSAITSAAVSGDGELGSIAVDAHTLEQMVKMELVDLALQIEMMEADAIQFLMHQPIELMSETKNAS